MPEDVLTIVQYTPTTNVGRDIWNTFQDKWRWETKESLMCEQSLSAIVNTLGKVNEDYKFLNIVHSRAGATSCSAIDRLDGETREKLSNKMVWFGLGPAEPILDQYCLDSKSVYSDMDWVTGPMGVVRKNVYSNGIKLYNVEFIESDKYGGFEDHSFLGDVYQKALSDFIREVKKNHGFTQINR